MAKRKKSIYSAVRPHFQWDWAWVSIYPPSFFVFGARVPMGRCEGTHGYTT